MYAIWLLFVEFKDNKKGGIYLDFMSWVEKESRGYGIVMIIMSAVILNFISNVVVLYIVEIISFNISDMPIEASVSETKDSIKMISLYLPCFLYASAALEEILFRLIPLTFAVEVWGTSKKVFLVAIVSSIIFGVLHGGYDHIFLQGISGFVYCIVFLKCGGLNENYIKGFLSSSTAHFLFNMTIVLILVVVGGNQYISFG